MDFNTILEAMTSCEQTSGMNMLEHGQSVHSAYVRLLDIIQGRSEAPDGWRIPDWAFSETLRNNLLPMSVVAPYLIYHDCGKPFVLETDADGKRHFPNHAAKSAEIWLSHKPDDFQVARLMAGDMDIHLLKADGISAFAQKPEAATWLLAGLAEVHANAAMFGGYTSTSFKIKAKHIAKRGAQIIRAIEGV